MRVVSRLSRRRRLVATLGLLVGVLSPWLSAGCGADDKSTICDAQCACKGTCTPAGHDACVKELEASLQLSYDKGCNSDADLFFKCSAEKGQCAGIGYTAADCVSETKTYYECLSRADCALLANVVQCGG